MARSWHRAARISDVGSRSRTVLLSPGWVGVRDGTWGARGPAPDGPFRQAAAMSESLPFAGRKLWFVGHRRRGAERVRPARAGVGGRGRRLGSRRHAVPRAAPGRRRSSSRPSRACRRAGRPSCRPRIRRCRGSSAAQFLRELVSARPAIVVAGAHGKGTTAAMIAFGLAEAGRDPAWLIGAPVPQLGSNAGAGAGWLVVEGDESDRTVFSLPAEIAVLTNLDLDHHTEFASEAELVAAFEGWLAAAPQVVRDAPAYDGPLALPGELNRLNAGTALAALELAGVARGERRGSARPVHRHRPAVRGARAERRHRRRRLRPPSDGGRRDRRRDPRALSRRTPAGPVPAAPVLAHPASGGRVRGRARGSRRHRRHGLYPARETPDPGRHGQADRGRAQRPRPAGCLDADGRTGRRLPRRRACGPATCCSSRVQATSIAPSGCWPGPGRPSAMANAFEPEENVSLARLTTIGTGGPARWFARPGRSRSSRQALRWARDGQVGAEVIGLGSNLLVHDDGFAGLVLRLEGELAAIDVDGIDPHRGRRRHERGLPPPRARRRPRRVRVRLGDPGHGRGRRTDERGRVRPRVARRADRRDGRRRRPRSHAHPGRARAVVPPLEPPPGRGRRPGHVRARASAGRRR